MVDKNKYRDDYAKLTMQQEVIFKKQVKRALNSFLLAYAKVYQNSIIGFAERTLLNKHAKQLQGIIAKRYEIVIPMFSKFAMAGFIEDITKDESDILINQQDRLVSNYVLAFAGTRAREIASTSLKRVQRVIDNGIKEGLAITEIAGLIRGIKKTSDARAELIARTEVHGATNYASIETAKNAEKELGIKMVKEWVATNDSRTRDTHSQIDGTTIDVDEQFNVGAGRGERPLDPSLPISEVVNCLLPESVVDYASPKSLTRRIYNGEVVTIETARGNKLTVTPNHPILTTRGWVAAKLIKKTDKIICADRLNRKTFTDFNIKDRDATVEQVFNSLSDFGSIVRKTGSVVNFHGDAIDKNVDIIHVDSFLKNRFKSLCFDPLKKLNLSHPDFGSGFFFAYSLLSGAFFKKFSRLVSDRLMSFFNLVKFLLVSHLRPLQSLSFTSAPRGNSITAKNSINRSSRHAEFNRDSLDGSSVSIFSDNIKDITISVYSGFVYNLHDYKSYYICNGIVNHNCRCTLIYKKKNTI